MWLDLVDPHFSELTTRTLHYTRWQITNIQFNANARNSFSFSYSDGVRMNLVASDPREKTTKALRRAVPAIWQVIKFLSDLKKCCYVIYEIEIHLISELNRIQNTGMKSRIEVQTQKEAVGAVCVSTLWWKNQIN